jgi:hypothetical protein
LLCAAFSRPLPTKTVTSARFGKAAQLIGWSA